MAEGKSRDSRRKTSSKGFGSVTEGLQRLYRGTLLPLEEDTQFQHFFSPALTDADFASHPMVLLLGQYSTGKTTFIQHLLGRDYPGLRIGPEPTTDKFIAVSHGESDQIIPGHVLVADSSLPFAQLQFFGNAFLSRFEGAKLKSSVLEGITLIDSPGILSGENLRVKRGYEMEEVVQWFADRADMILLLFDVSKLDISDEFRRLIYSLKGNDYKIHFLFNKADQLTTPQLMRVYGGLMWSLSKVINSPEVSRVYIGSFWDEPLVNDEQQKLFESEKHDLHAQLAQLPRGAAVRKLNDLIKRGRLARMLAYLLDYLRSSMPMLRGKAEKQEELISRLPEIYREIAKARNLPIQDFPDAKLMQEKLRGCDFTKFVKLNALKMQALEKMLSVELPKLLQLLPKEDIRIAESVPSNPHASPPVVQAKL
mmetsp:Transcript_827/g.2064  ORF Transcript_827/g.2064 Transcript_827/m.2064 type:complete len:424 (-) Transcript_827:87-1358(-)